MPELSWQKSTYSAEAANCVYAAATPTGAVLLRESDEPETILTTGSRQLGALISALKADPFAHTPETRRHA
ncbi:MULTISPECIES: DUF397 domain-containing protein [unclassified Streptomyces]|uniref:DUF397 domain-containing protein n=1 Tax=unclassified Streptomyces TaxID=2593676 RepID=UPI0023662EA6|nr:MULTISPECIES: DUF397 domain-containing protein [unclassified Streptomyces]MDF3140655.1 DUF397 domain-containing protein [Streptomyces sp. T21Q-yed]WDF38493.1 DUF397 domain-containing protein [Streptomyces sp. T12]